MKTWRPKQSIVSREAQWTQQWLRAQSQVDPFGVLHSVKIYTVLKTALRKVDQSSMGYWMHSVLIAIE